MTTQNKALVRRILEEGFNQGKLDILDAIIAADHVSHDPANPNRLIGPEGARQEISMYRSAFPDLRFTIEEQIAENDRVVTRWTARGTHNGQLFGMPPTGRKATVTGVTIDRIANNKLAEAWNTWDLAGLLTQLGVSKQPATSAQAQTPDNGSRRPTTQPRLKAG